MVDMEKVIKVLQDALTAKENFPWAKAEMSFEFIEMLLELLKEQDEREKGICKAVCDFIRSGISTDTKADQDYVCHEIQNRFIHFERSMSGNV